MKGIQNKWTKINQKKEIKENEGNRDRNGLAHNLNFISVH